MTLREVLALTPTRFEEWIRLSTTIEKARILREMHKRGREDESH